MISIVQGLVNLVDFSCFKVKFNDLSFFTYFFAGIKFIASINDIFFVDLEISSWLTGIERIKYVWVTRHIPLQRILSWRYSDHFEIMLI